MNKIKAGNNMNYQLYGSTTSPYVRKIRMFMMNQNIEFEFKNINILDPAGAKILKEINPINKIPVLVFNNQKIWESRVIFNFLNTKKLNIEDENRLSLIDALIDTTINLYMMKRNNIVIDETNAFFQRQFQRIKDLLSLLDADVNHFNQWNYLSMSLYAYLDWAQFREFLQIDNYPNLKTFIETWQNNHEVQITKIITY
jgi:glutathione S-transferase